ncbi:hypothetical protein ACYULU_12265 [Breznakiellaceae bacterium SP9]
MKYFNELEIDLNDEAYFSSEINERTMENPNMHISEPCTECDDSLDAYAKILIKETFVAPEVR